MSCRIVSKARKAEKPRSQWPAAQIILMLVKLLLMLAKLFVDALSSIFVDANAQDCGTQWVQVPQKSWISAQTLQSLRFRPPNPVIWGGNLGKVDGFQIYVKSSNPRPLRFRV